MIKIPTLKELFDSIVSDLENEMGITIPLFGKVAIRGLAAVQAAKLKMYYLAIGKVQKNIFLDTADPEANGGTLERFARIKLGRNPFAAIAGQYEVEVTGVVGSTIPAAQTFKSNDDSLNPGKLFQLDAAYTLIASPDVITIRALEAGLTSKLLVGNRLSATSPISGVDKLATVWDEVVEPLAAEEIEEYRLKAIQAYQLEPQGGAASDYRIWAADAQGVKTVYPYAKSGFSGEINLFIEANILDSIDGKGTPSEDLLDDVEAVVELDPDTSKPITERGRRPLGVFQVHYLPVTPKDVTITINSFPTITTPVADAIEDSIELMVNSIRPFVSGADVLADKNDILDKNKIIGAILQASPGSSFGAINLTIDGVAYDTYTFLNGDIPYLITPITINV